MKTSKHNGQTISPLQKKLVSDLRQLLSSQSLSQNQCAIRCGVSAGSLSDLLHGKRAFSAGILNRIREVLRTDKASESCFFQSVRQYRKLCHTADIVRKEALFALASGNTGIGKTTTLQRLLGSVPETYYLKIENDLTWRGLLRRIALSWGLPHIPVGYRIERLWDSMRAFTEQNFDSPPLLIIDEAEELSTSVCRKLKRLHTLTEGCMGILISAHPSLRRRLAKAAGLQADTETRCEGRPETAYMPLWRRLMQFHIPPVSFEDIETVCRQELQIQNAAVITLAQQRWTNYATMSRDIFVAASVNLPWTTMDADHFSFITSAEL